MFTKVIDEHAQLMASYTQFPPQFFGQTTTANPASADAIRVAHDGVDRRGRQCQNQFSDPLERVMRLAWRFAHDGDPVPPEMAKLETSWVNAATQTPSGTTEAIFKQISGGSVPPTSDVVLERLGYTAVERQRLALDRAKDAGASILAELATSLEAKDARINKAIAADIGGTPAGDSAAPVAPPNAPAK